MVKYVHPNQTNQQVYVQVLTKLQEVIRNKRTVLWSRCWFVHRDSSQARKVILIFQFSLKNKGSGIYLCTQTNFRI